MLWGEVISASDGVTEDVDKLFVIATWRLVDRGIMKRIFYHFYL